MYLNNIRLIKTAVLIKLNIGNHLRSLSFYSLIRFREIIFVLINSYRYLNNIRLIKTALLIRLNIGNPLRSISFYLSL